MSCNRGGDRTVREEEVTLVFYILSRDVNERKKEQKKELSTEQPTVTQRFSIRLLSQYTVATALYCCRHDDISILYRLWRSVPSGEMYFQQKRAKTRKQWKNYEGS